MTLQFEIHYDENDKPVSVNTFDGFAHISRPFNPEEDGWMEYQLNKKDFPAIRAGRQIEALVDEVNYLRRENFRLKKSEEMWMGAAGFGKKKTEEKTKAPEGTGKNARTSGSV